MLKERELYNKDLKQRYLETITESTKEYTNYQFLHASRLEHKLDKDIANFTYDEFTSFLIELNAQTESSLNASLSTIRKYINFAIKEGYAENYFNISDMFDGVSLSNYINKQAKENRIIDKKEFNQIINGLWNAQDAAIIALIWDGIVGERCSELRGLKIGDVDFKNSTLYITRNEERVGVKVADSVIKLVKQAIDEETYVKNNGELEDVKDSLKETKLANTGYVIRPCGSKKEGQVSEQVIRVRAQKIFKLYGNPHIRIGSLRDSGMIDYAKTIKLEKGSELGEEDYIKINKRYGLREDLWRQTKRKIEDCL